MKNLSKKTKILVLLVIVIIIAGISVTFTIGLNFDLRYQESKKMEVYIGKNFDINNIKQITDEILPNQSVIIQKVEVFEDTVSILAKDITDEQKTNIINRINEKYETQVSADSIEITTIPHTRGRDIVRPYIAPFIIATAIIALYIMIRYHRLGSIRTIVKAVFLVIVAQAILLSIIAIARIPIGRLTIPMVLAVYMLTLAGITTHFENKLKKEKSEEK